MSAENVETVRAMNDAFAANNFEGALAKLHPDVVWHGTTGGLDDGRVVRGHRELIEAFVENYEAWESLELETTKYIDAGDRVLVFFHEIARGRESGAEVETETAVIFTVKDGVIVEVHPYMDQAAAIEAAGLA
jgi:ketosteroid isomerase-like protein